MPVLGFKERFASKIQSGAKMHTIRGIRKQPIKVGDKLFLYVGLRTKKCYRILPEPVICSQIETITILADGRIAINGRKLTKDNREGLALLDGFSSHKEMMRFWRDNNTLPFYGHIIHWNTPKGTLF